MPFKLSIFRFAYFYLFLLQYLKYMDLSMQNQLLDSPSNSDDFQNVLESYNTGSFPDIPLNPFQLDYDSDVQSVDQPQEEDKGFVETRQDAPVLCQTRKQQLNDEVEQKPADIQPRNDSIQNLPQFQSIFKQNHKQGKNSNFTKLITRLFNNEIETLNKTGLLTKHYYRDFIEAKKSYEKYGKRNIQIKALEILFGTIKNNSKFTKANRSILIEMLNDAKFINQQILYSSFIKQYNKKQHLLATKVYKLRCRSRLLMGRTQTK